MNVLELWFLILGAYTPWLYDIPYLGGGGETDQIFLNITVKIIKSVNVICSIFVVH